MAFPREPLVVNSRIFQLANYLLSKSIAPTSLQAHLERFSMRLALWLFFILPLFACQSNIASNQKLMEPPPMPKKDFWVPRWYAELPQLPGCQLAYAYSGIYVNADRKKEALLTNGAANLAKNTHVSLEVGWAGTQHNIYTQTASYIKEEDWEIRAENLKDEIEILKEFRLENSMLAVVGKCSDQQNTEQAVAFLDDQLVNVSTDSPPDWVGKPMQAAGQIFGVGAAAGRTTAAKAWDEAERQAKADLALRLAGRSQVLEKNVSQNHFGSEQLMSETKAKLTLQNIQVIRHAYSRQGNIYYALVQIPAQ